MTSGLDQQKGVKRTQRTLLYDLLSDPERVARIFAAIPITSSEVELFTTDNPAHVQLPEPLSIALQYGSILDLVGPLQEIISELKKINFQLSTVTNDDLSEEDI